MDVFEINSMSEQLKNLSKKKSINNYYFQNKYLNIKVISYI